MPARINGPSQYKARSELHRISTNRPVTPNDLPPRPGGYLTVNRDILAMAKLNQELANHMKDIPVTPLYTRCPLLSMASTNDSSSTVNMSSTVCSLEPEPDLFVWHSDGPSSGHGYSGELPPDSSLVMSITISTLMTLAADISNKCPDNHFITTSYFLHSLKTDEHKTPFNVEGISGVMSVCPMAKGSAIKNI